MDPDLHTIKKRHFNLRNTFLEKALRDWRPRDEREWAQNKWLPYEDDEEPTQQDYKFIFAHDYYAHPEKWEEYVTGNKTTNWDGEEVDETKWRIKDPAARKEYDRISKLIKDFKNWENFRTTRIPPREYDAREKQLWRDGIGKLWLKPQRTGDLHSLSVWFPDNFEHLVNQATVDKKMATDAGFHISLAYEDRLKDGLETELQKFYDDYFDLKDPDDPSRGYHWKEVTFNKRGGNTVSSGSTYQFVDLEDPFVKAMHEIQLKGSKEGDSWAHISLD
jgi:hypothetical protein